MNRATDALSTVELEDNSQLMILSGPTFEFTKQLRIENNNSMEL